MLREQHRPGELPWGWWLRARGNVLEDETGRSWRSVRDAFWQGELNFDDVHFSEEQHELMLRTLSSIDRGWVNGSETKHELFGGDMPFWRFYQCWLASIGLISTTASSGFQGTPLEGRLTPEGTSVLMMLRATRFPIWESLPMAEVVEAVAMSRRARSDVEQEAVVTAFEKTVGLRRHVFARERIGRSYLITLTGIATDARVRMPTRRVMWSMAFADPIIRNELFAWFAERVDRWDDWGDMAFRKGADVLGTHLLGLLAVSKLGLSAS